jgi:EmrB/QacA subfamily drug resistance transporter
MRSKAMILVALLLAAFVINLDTTIVNVALPALVRELHATTTQLQWVVDAYNLVFAALLLTFGSLSDRFGRKGMLLAGLTVFGAASLAGGFTTSPGELIAARSVMGLGAAMTFPATLSLISNVFTERRERARAIGLWGAIGGVAIALGPIVGGWLLEHFSWASIFVAMAPVAALGVLLVAVSVPTSKNRDDSRADIPGLVLSAAAMGLLVFTLIEAPAYGWASARSLLGFAVSAVLLATFVWWEQRISHPMLDVRLFRNMRFSAASGAVTVAFFTLFGFIFLITLYFQFVRGYAPLSTGVRLLPVALSVGVGSVVGTQLAVRFGTKLIVTLGLVAMAGFYVWAAVTASATLSYGTIAVQMVVYGLGMGLTSAPATESIMGAVSRRKAGVGSAVNDSTRLLGGTLGVAVLGSVYASLYGSRLTARLPAGLPAQVKEIAHQSLGAAYAVSARVPGAAGRAVHDAATNAFLHGLSVGCLVAGGVAAAGAVLAVFFLPSHPLLPAQPASPAVTPPPSVPAASPAGESVRLWADVVREAGDAAGDRAAITGLGDAVVEHGEDARVVRHERADAHREHDGDNQRQDAAHDPGDGLAVARRASRPSAADGNAAEDRREQASGEGEREQDEGHGGHQAGHAENQGGHTQAVRRPG